MAKKKRSAISADHGNYVWRGGKKIELKKVEDRFTIIPNSREQLEKVRSAPGVRDIKPVTNQVFKVETTVTERDSAMASLRSNAFNTIAHHAYRPKDAE